GLNHRRRRLPCPPLSSESPAGSDRSRRDSGGCPHDRQAPRQHPATEEWNGEEGGQEEGRVRGQERGARSQEPVACSAGFAFQILRLFHLEAPPSPNFKGRELRY